jgi:hypothetical protein
MIRPLRRLAAAAALIAAAAGVAAANRTAVDRAALQSLAGTWASPAPEPWYGGWGTREFVLADGRWSLTFVHALDRDMTQRTFQFRTGGPFVVGAADAAVPGAFRTVFHEQWKHLTRLTPDDGLAAAMGLAACGLPVNLEADISVTGCAAWKPVAVCGEDHDLLALDDTGLRFGVRPRDNDMCTADRTPAALLPAVVRR